MQLLDPYNRSNYCYNQAGVISLFCPPLHQIRHVHTWNLPADNGVSLHWNWSILNVQVQHSMTYCQETTSLVVALIYMNIQIKMCTWPSFHKDLLPWEQSAKKELQTTGKKKGDNRRQTSIATHLIICPVEGPCKVSRLATQVASHRHAFQLSRAPGWLDCQREKMTSVVYWLTMKKENCFKPAEKRLYLVGILASRWSDLVQLTSFNHRVGFSYGIPSCCLVIKRAAMLLRVSMQGTESKTTTALESCQSYSLLTWKAPVRLLPGLLTSRSWSKSSLCPTWWRSSCLRLFHGCIYWCNQRWMAFAWTCGLR